MSTHTTAVEVRYAETDASGIVWHGSYIAWLEAARVNHIRAQGLEFADFIASGYNFVVSDINLRYHLPARFGDVVHVESTVSKLQSRRMLIDYQLKRASDDTLLVTAQTTLICVDHNGRVTTIPPAWRERWLATQP